MSVNTKYGVSGFFRLVVRKVADMSIVQDTGYFKNVITNYGMNNLGMPVNSFGGCTVGSGTSPELPTDSTIQSFVARTSTFAPSSTPTVIAGVDSGKYYSGCRATWRFADGAAAGNLSEVGVIATYTAPNYYLFSRTLIKDESGNPITITVLPDEVLDVYYEGRIYPQADPTISDIDIGGTSYNCKIQNGKLTSSVAGNVFIRGFPLRSGSGGALAYNGPLSSAPDYNSTGTSLGQSNAPASAPYANDSFTCVTTYIFAPSVATGSHKSYQMAMGNQGPTYVMELTPAYNKIATVELKLTHSVTWSRIP